MNVFFTQDITGNQAILHDTESKHCNVVLRKSVGDTVFVMDGNGLYGEGIIQSQDKKSTTIALKLKEIHKPDKFKGVAICPTKNINRFEFFLEKATELGINNIYPILSKRSERKIIKPERLQKVLLSAAKQSLNFHLPKMHPLQSFSDFIKDHSDRNCFIAHFDEENPNLVDCLGNEKGNLIVIGPEGDFTDEELLEAHALGFNKVNLSSRRLRTETAGIVASVYISTHY